MSFFKLKTELNISFILSIIHHQHQPTVFAVTFKIFGVGSVHHMPDGSGSFPVSQGFSAGECAQNLCWIFMQIHVFNTKI